MVLADFCSNWLIAGPVQVVSMEHKLESRASSTVRHTSAGGERVYSMQWRDWCTRLLCFTLTASAAFTHSLFVSVGPTRSFLLWAAACWGLGCLSCCQKHFRWPLITRGEDSAYWNVTRHISCQAALPELPSRRLVDRWSVKEVTVESPPPELQLTLNAWWLPWHAAFLTHRLSTFKHHINSFIRCYSRLQYYCCIIVTIGPQMQEVHLWIQVNFQGFLRYCTHKNWKDWWTDWKRET